MSSHPFLSLTGNPAWENLTPEHIREDITLALEKAEANLQRIRDLNPEEINFRNTVKALENASYELYYAWGLVTHLDSVCNSAELREVHNEMLPAVSAFGAKITLDAELWKVLQIFAESKETSSLKPIDRRLLEETLLDFKEAGADLPNEKRQRLEEISQELAQVTQKFSEQVLDATNEWKLVVREEDKLKVDINGKYIENKDDSPGLALMKIGPNAIYNGYTDAQASEKKIITDVVEDGDRWFNTGDLLKTMDVGFALGRQHYQFVDRVGDTFRWKSENVSTNEVGEILNSFEQVNMANVFGVKVPNSEGRAGMVAFNCDPNTFDWNAFSSFVDEKLPSYARPVFVRIIEELETTGTFKLKKNELRDEAFHLDKVNNDLVYVREPKSESYTRLTSENYEQINNGSISF